VRIPTLSHSASDDTVFAEVLSRRTARGDTPLLAAVRGGHERAVTLLLSYGVDVATGVFVPRLLALPATALGTAAAASRASSIVEAQAPPVPQVEWPGAAPASPRDAAVSVLSELVGSVVDSAVSAEFDASAAAGACVRAPNLLDWRTETASRELPCLARGTRWRPTTGMEAAWLGAPIRARPVSVISSLKRARRTHSTQ
jgi:hypothetical protein